MAKYANFFTVLLAVCSLSLRSVNSQRYEATLDPEGKFVVGWVVDQVQQRITFDVAVETLGYVGLGFSDTTDMYDSDIALAYVYSDGTSEILDCFGDGNFRPTEDFIQDYTLLYGYESATHSYLRFSRLLDTGDVEDRPITNNTTYLIWAYGVADNMAYHGSNRGSYSVNLIQPDVKLIKK